MAGIPGDASDARRGVRLRRAVTPFPFESSAGETKTAGISFLHSIRNLSNTLRIREDGTWVGKLCLLLKYKLAAESASIEEFDEICEGFVSLLYFSLVFNRQEDQRNIKTIFRYFVDKWFVGYETCDWNKLVLDIDVLYQRPSFATVLLLYSHLLGVPLLNAKSCEALLTWRSPDLVAPQWLREMVSSSRDTYANFNVVLHKCLNYGFNTEVDISPEYLKGLSTFIDATWSYKDNHDASMELLSSINETRCGNFLRGWCQVVRGLNLEKQGKHESALLMYKEAINCCPDCFHALYYSSRVLKQIGAVETQLECLQLLSLVKVENLTVDSSIQRTLISYLLPPVNHLSLRATWLLASTSLACKKWRDARDHFRSLLADWTEELNVDCRPARRRDPFLLAPSDQIPELPSKTCVKLGLVSSLMCLKEYEDVEMELKEELLEGTILDRFEEIETGKQIQNYSALLCEQVLAEALYRQQKFDDALAKCGRMLVWTEGVHGSSANWRVLLLLTKAYMYKLLSLLYSRRSLDTEENRLHFSRLEDHSLKLLEAEKGDFLDPNTSHEMFFQNEKMFLVERIKDLD